MKKVFVNSSSAVRKTFFALLLALLLMTVDNYTSVFDSTKSDISQLFIPLQLLANFPYQMKEWVGMNTTSRTKLEQKNVSLEKERLILLGQLQRSAELAAENLRLRQLLNATELLMQSVLVTEVIGVSPNPVNHTVTVDRGTNDGVYIGQPVLDADGLMGQVVEVYENYSKVLLITDINHALPVQVLRNGLRSIVEGISDFNLMALRFVSPTVDIVEGDKLVSSGLGGRFPMGYPVGTVSSISQKPGEKFMEIKVIPSAKLDRSRHLLLVFTIKDGDVTRDINE
ncbi:MAG: rod shape-determining protein MreC [Cellvibrionales bacterium TMED47]|nr:rod shape-determining protein MreC [Porticoccaceae bacterium]RPG84514.1 MAG: rod shape-determining protein MreC [Cellvibrionales bacterium TMED47]